MQQPNAIRFSPDGASLPAHISAWIDAQEASVVTLGSGDELMSIGLRTRPRFVVFDARKETESVLAALHRVKNDSYTGVVPCAVLCGKKSGELSAAFDSGADEVIREGMQPPEAVRRLTAMLSARSIRFRTAMMIAALFSAALPMMGMRISPTKNSDSPNTFTASSVADTSTSAITPIAMAEATSTAIAFFDDHFGATVTAGSRLAGPKMDECVPSENTSHAP